MPSLAKASIPGDLIVVEDASPPHQTLQLRQQHDAFLLFRIGAADHCSGGAGAGVEGEVGHVGGDGDVEEVSGGELHPVFEGLAPVHHCDAFQHVDRGLMRGVFVGFRAASGRDGQEVHADAGRADGFSGDAGVLGEALFAVEGVGRAQFAAGGHGRLRMGMGMARDYHGARTG